MVNKHRHQIKVIEQLITEENQKHVIRFGREDTNIHIVEKKSSSVGKMEV
jgi:hypothetical protein